MQMRNAVLFTFCTTVFACEADHSIDMTKFIPRLQAICTGTFSGLVHATGSRSNYEQTSTATWHAMTPMRVRSHVRGRREVSSKSLEP